MTFTVAWMPVPDWQVGAFQTLLMSWDFHEQPSVEFTQNGAKTNKHPLSARFAGGNALLMREARGEWLDLFKLTGSV